MTSDTPAMAKASASRNTENLRGVEAVVSVDRFSNSEGAEGSDILTVALRLAGSGAMIGACTGSSPTLSPLKI
jgi:hypothetical protein